MNGVTVLGEQDRRIAFNKTEAAELLGVSVDFFDAHIAGEIRCVRRGRRRLYSETELRSWLDREAEFAVERSGL
jgi:excisionase family DNA binding protein